MLIYEVNIHISGSVSTMSLDCIIAEWVVTHKPIAIVMAAIVSFCRRDYF